MGCAALDKGTNQPNKFLDAMSSESMLPHFSDGRRDDVIQAAYVRAMTGFWSDPANNPARAAHGRTGAGRMIDMSRAHVWCWDARPYPWFPALTKVWSDGTNFRLGHWIEGKIGNMRLSEYRGQVVVLTFWSSRCSSCHCGQRASTAAACRFQSASAAVSSSRRL